MTTQPKLAIPGITVAFIIAAAVVAYWCRDPFMVVLMVLVICAASILSTVLAIGGELP